MSTTINGYVLRNKSNSSEITRWANIPKVIRLPNGDYVFDADVSWVHPLYVIQTLTWDEPDPIKTPQQIRIETFLADIDYQNLLQQIVTASPAQIKTYVQNNVTDLASAKVVLTKIVLLLALIARS